MSSRKMTILADLKKAGTCLRCSFGNTKVRSSTQCTHCKDWAFFRPRLKLLILLAVCSFARAATVRAEEAPSSQTISARLQAVHEKIEKEEEKFSELRGRETELEKGIAGIDRDLEKLDQNRQVVLQNVDKLSAEIATLEIAIARLQQEIRDAEANKRARTIGIFKLYRRTAALDYLVNASSATDLIRRATYLSKIAEHDKERLERLGALIHEFDVDRQEATERKQARELELDKVKMLETELGEKKLKQAKLVREVKEQRDQQEKVLQKLRKGAQELEALMTSVMGGEEPKVVPPVETLPVKKEPKVEEAKVDPKAEYRGPGLASLRGRLPLPAKGMVVQRFGEQHHEQFRDMLFRKGLEFNTPVGSNVSAVAPGKVVFDRTLPGYGNVVILDHGERYYTLYGRLGTIVKQIGDIVRPGDTLATVAQPDPKGSNFYFEIRQKGKALDPFQFFRNKPLVQKG